MNRWIETYGRVIVFVSVVSFYVILAWAFFAKDHATLVRFNYFGEAHIEFILFGLGLVPALILSFSDAKNMGERFRNNSVMKGKGAT